MCARRRWAAAVTAAAVATTTLAIPRAGAAGTEAMRFGSNRWTQAEAPGGALPLGTGSPPGYRRAAASDALELWVRPDDLAIRVLDRRTGYAWASAVEAADTAGLNETWVAIARSALTVGYIDEKDRAASESITSGPSRVAVSFRADGFDAEVAFAVSGVVMRIEARLAGDALTLRIPADGIREPSLRLADVEIWPFLGAVRGDRTAGYVFIPDGCGALVRFRASSAGVEASYAEQVFGHDAGIDVLPTWEGLTNEVQQARLPVFGAAHAPGAARASAFVAAIEGGAELARIEAAPAGATTPFTRVGARFVYRKQYFQPTSRSLGGLNVWQSARAGIDAEIRWFFLAGPDADYVGMARRYQRRLAERGLLVRRVPEAGTGPPLLITVPGADTGPGFIRPRVVTATTAAQLAGMVEDLVAAGLPAPVVAFEGYAAGGIYGHLPRRLPVEPALGGGAGLAAAAARIRAAGSPLLLVTNYTLASEGAGGFSVRGDVARLANGQPLKAWRWYRLSPRASLAMAAADAPRFRALGADGLLLTDDSFRLTTDFSVEGGRAGSVAAARRLAAVLRGAGLSFAALGPNEYLLGLADRVVGAPTSSSQYLFETDTVPFYQIVLKGYVDCYAPAINLSADPVESLLRAVEYGSLPAFTLTADQPRKLAETAFEYVTTGWYPLWRDRVLAAGADAARALAGVRSSGIAARGVPAPGVVRVAYDNGTVIVVNYTAREYADRAGPVPARGFAVFASEAR